MRVSRHFENYNAVITVVTPCKYVSGAEHIESEMKLAEGTAWGTRKAKDKPRTGITFVLQPLHNEKCAKNNSAVFLCFSVPVCFTKCIRATSYFAHKAALIFVRLS